MVLSVSNPKPTPGAPLDGLGGHRHIRHRPRAARWDWRGRCRGTAAPDMFADWERRGYFSVAGICHTESDNRVRCQASTMDIGRCINVADGLYHSGCTAGDPSFLWRSPQHQVARRGSLARARVPRVMSVWEGARGSRGASASEVCNGLVSSPRPRWVAA